MQLPFFYISAYTPGEKNIVLDENNSRHIVQVLRMQREESLHLTDGKGHLLTAIITDPHKKHCVVTVTDAVFSARRHPQVTIAISLLKNANRFEWFLEKATEIGVARVIPLICDRTEKERAKAERLQNILVSALLQSRQVWLPQMPEPVKFTDFIKVPEVRAIPRKLIAHCLEDEKYSLNSELADGDSMILIGPEGDFTTEEIGAALANGYQPVTLGTTRLRTETAGVVAAALLCVR